MLAWSSPEGRNYAEFHARLLKHLKRLDAAGINYRKPTAIDRPK